MLGLRGIGPIKGGRRGSVSYGLRIVAKRDGRIGISRDLRNQPDLDPSACNVEIKEWRVLRGVTYGKPRRLKAGCQ